MRFGDSYHENGDGTLDVIRTGAKNLRTYGSGEWAGVEGDQRKFKKRRIWG